MIFNDMRYKYEYYFIKVLTNLRMMVLPRYGPERGGGARHR